MHTRRSSIHTTLAAVALTVVMLTGCQQSQADGTHFSVFQHFSIEDGNVAIHSPTAVDAMLSAAGELRIDDKMVVVTPAQQALLRQYHAAIVQLRGDALSIANEGKAMARTAIGEVARGLASGNPDQIGPNIEAQADKIEASATAICLRLATVQTMQGAIAATLPAFKPYATIKDHDSSGCSDGHDRDATAGID